jgi:hypothetical protein
MAIVPASGPIRFSDLQAVMGGSGPVSLSQYKQSASTYYSRGVPGVTDTDVALSQFQGKAKALKSGLQYRVFNQLIQLSAGSAGGGGSAQYAGGGGAGGVIITPSKTLKARYIIFQYGNGNGGTGRCLNLGGLYAYTQTNGTSIITSSMTVTSLDNHPNFPPSYLVDNNEASFCHSSCGSEYPWFKVDLGAEYALQRVELVNRQDCCRSRVAGLTCVLQNASGTTVYTSGLMTLRDGATNYQEGHNGFAYYTCWPGVSTTICGTDSLPATMVASPALGGGGANGGYGGGAGIGLGAGGGGGGYWYAIGPQPGGNGASGFAYIKLNGTEYLALSSGSYTFTSAGTAKLLLMGGGGGGGNNAGTNSKGGGGGGAGYLQTYYVSVSNGTVATITIGGGGSGASSTDGGATSVVINSTTYSAAGGGNGATNQNGGAGSSSGGTGGNSGGVTSGGQGGSAQAGTTSQGTVGFTALIKHDGGYFEDDTTYFDSLTETYSTGLTTDTWSVNTATGGIVPAEQTWDLYSVEWFGYFYAPTAGSYTFYTFSDDASYLWIGSTALSGYTTGNALINNGSLHGMTEVSGTITLAANIYYPIRIQFGEKFSGDGFQASFAGPGISKTQNWSGYAFYGLGTASSFPAPSARLLKAVNSSAIDRAYYVNVSGTSTLTYCLMDSKWDGGGWMMLMKSTRGNTFGYNSTYWTDTGTTLNTGSADRSDADAKFGTMNTAQVKDVLALWPDVGSTGGSISGQTTAWTWLVNHYYYGARATAITGFSSASSRDATTAILNTFNPNSFPGYSSSIWSSQAGAMRHIMGGGSHLGSNQNIRWGFLWNNEGDYASIDAVGGIGFNVTWSGSYTYSSGDFYGCCGTAGLNRTMRVELYGR